MESERRAMDGRSMYCCGTEDEERRLKQEGVNAVTQGLVYVASGKGCKDQTGCG